MADLSVMPRCAGGIYCKLCEKKVFDLGKANLTEVNRVLDHNPGACVIIREKHAAVRTTWKWAEKTAGWMKGRKMPGIAAVLLAICMFFTSCRRRAGSPAWDKNGSPAETLHEQQ